MSGFRPGSRVVALLAVVVVAACSSDPDAAPSPIDANALDAGLTGDAGRKNDAGTTCTAAEEQLLEPIDTVSTGEVTVLDGAASTKTLFVDATAGGIIAQTKSPRLYVSLGTASRAEVTDRTAATSTAWDIAIKRPILFTNGGEGGPGLGGAVMIAKDFHAVTAADATGQTFAPESFFEDDCTPKLDPTGAVLTSFSSWYDYDEATHILTPHPGTWLVKGATGALFKLQILSYYAARDGGIGEVAGRYTFEVEAL